MKIVLTGGTYSGKTTILKELSNRGYNIFGEVAGENMSILSEIFGINGYKKWRKENFLEFQKMNIFSNLKRDVLITNELCFLDRGIYDWIASLKREGIKISDGIFNLVSQVDYNFIFIIDDLPEHKIRPETGRVLNKDVSILWKKFIMNEYKERFGSEKVVIVPYFKGDFEYSVNKRVDFILDFLNKNNKG